MHPIHLGVVASTFALALAPTRASAQAAHHPAASFPAAGKVRRQTNATILPLHNGRNDIDLLGRGNPGEVIVSRRGNGNAHGFSTVLFQVLAPDAADGRSDRLWQVIPFFGGPHDTESGADLFSTFEGADCILRDLRVMRRVRAQPVQVVIASRDFGASFADSAPVQFDYYELRANTEPLGPTYIFHHVRTARTKRTYCDVDDAFNRELGLGPVGIVRWDGPR